MVRLLVSLTVILVPLARMVVNRFNWSSAMLPVEVKFAVPVTLATPVWVMAPPAVTVRSVAVVVPRITALVSFTVIFVPQAVTVEKLLVELASVILPPEPVPEFVKFATPDTEDGPDCVTAPLAVTVRLFAVIVPRTNASGRPGSCPAPRV